MRNEDASNTLVIDPRLILPLRLPVETNEFYDSNEVHPGMSSYYATHSMARNEYTSFEGQSRVLEKGYGDN